MTICVDRLYASIEQPVLITRCVFHTLLQVKAFCTRRDPTMPRVFSPRAEPLRRGAADEGVDAAAGDHDDGHRCEHAHDEDDVRRLPSSSDAGCDDQLSGLAGVQMLREAVGTVVLAVKETPITRRLETKAAMERLDVEREAKNKTSR